MKTNGSLAYNELLGARFYGAKQALWLRVIQTKNLLFTIKKTASLILDDAVRNSIYLLTLIKVF